MKDRFRKILSAFGLGAAKTVGAPPAAVPAPGGEPSPLPAPAATAEMLQASALAVDTMQFLQRHLVELEKQVCTEKEKNITSAAESKVRQEMQRQAEAAYEKLAAVQVSADEKQKSEQRLDRLEDFCRRISAAFQKNSAAAAAAAAENAALKGLLSALEARLAGVEGRLTGIPAAREALSSLGDRFGSIEARLSSVETAANGLTQRSGLRDKLNERESVSMCGRLDKLETGSVSREYLDGQVEIFEKEAARIRKLEGELEAAAKKLLRLEAASGVLLGEQAKAAENAMVDGAAIEELRAKVINISVIFDHLRRHSRNEDSAGVLAGLRCEKQSKS